MRFLAVVVLLFATLTAQAQVPPPALAANAWMLLDVGTNQPLVEQEADKRIEPASLTKLMTAYLVFGALEAKTLTLDQIVPVSEKDWQMGG